MARSKRARGLPRGLLVSEKLMRRTPNGGVEPCASRCTRCGKLYFPVKRVCPDCFVEGCLETVRLPERGRLISYSIAHQSFLGIPTPYAFGYIELEGGLIVYALLSDWDPPEKKLRPGATVEQVIEETRRDEAGNPIVAFKYRPVG